VIGVRCEREDAAVFAEFFELFKTPWELYEPGREYDVVLAAAGDVPDIDAGLLVIYGTRATCGDERLGAPAGLRFSGGVLRYRGTSLPVYGTLLTFVEREPGTTYVSTDDGAAAGVRIRTGDLTVVRLGYDLAHEVRSLLSDGQPAEQAGLPAVDVHIAMLRALIVEAGLPLVEIPPAPAGADFAVCLTHDIDFAGIRHHRLDHTVWGFLYRATLGTLGRVVRGRLSLARCAASWRAAASLPLVYLGWVKDFWEPFGWYLRTEHGVPATYFLIPFKRRPGDRVTARHAARRGAAYDVADVAASAVTLRQHGCELGVHGIDAWHSVDKGRAELERVAALTGATRVGVRMHWLLRDAQTPRVLEDAGYAWDSSLGYNETVGYLNGTTQPFRPAGATSLLELPLHIQDGALFYPGRLNLSEADAWLRCARLIENAKAYGGVLTVLWHDRSHAPERFWGDFYVRLVNALKAHGAWFGTAGNVVEWFAKRREVRFERSAMGIRLRYHGDAISPALTLRVHRRRPAGGAGPQSGASWIDIPWAGDDLEDMERRLTQVVQHEAPSMQGAAA
jgi:peptidoglycan/xylan/chitin deacetylase (PgdA/CDA1 family)